MDRRSWPWKKKSSEKTVTDSVVANGTTHGNQDKNQKAKYVQVSVESYDRLTGLEEKVKAYEEKVKKYEEQMGKYEEQVKKYEEQMGKYEERLKAYEEQVQEYDEQIDKYDERVRSLEDQNNDLNDKLSASQSEMINKEKLVEQHAKVAEEAVSGWEKAEAEAVALKSHLESVTLAKLTAEDRASHMDGALKECMRQIRNLKEDHEQRLQEVVLTKTKQCEKIKLDLEAKIAKFHQELLRSEAENAAISRSLQERSNMLFTISEEKSEAEAEIELLKSKIESSERDINSLKYEVHLVSKELEIRNEEKNMSVKSAEVANKQHMEGVKKITKLEAECQRLRGLVRKKLPGPAALAQMKLEVESWGRDYGETRTKKPPVKSSAPHFSPVAENPFNNVQEYKKENELLAGRLFAMEEETKMLKEALAKRNSELQASRNLCAKIGSKLQSLELQMKQHNQQKLYSPTTAEGSVIQMASNLPSLASMSEDGNDDVISCADSCASTLISDRLQIKKERDPEKFNQNKNAKNMGLMDDFLEMEKLAGFSNDAGGAVSLSRRSDKKISDISCYDASSDPLSEKQQAFTKPESLSPSQVASTFELPVKDVDQSPIQTLKVKFFSLLEYSSDDADVMNVLDEINRVVQEEYGSLRSINCSSEEKHCSGASSNRLSCPEVTGVSANKDISLPQEDESATKSGHLISKELEYAISKINEFVVLLGKEATTVHQICLDGDSLNEKAANFSVTSNKVLQSDISLATFVLDLSEVLAKACEFRCSIFGYRGACSEASSPDCIDKVALPEDKMVKKDPSEDGYDHSCAPISNPEVPDYCNIAKGYESYSKSCEFSLEAYYQLKSERDNLENELAVHTESLQMTRSQLEETNQHLADIKSHLAAVQNSHSLAETQLKCMAESYRSLERRAEELETQLKCSALSHISLERCAGELQTEVSLLREKTQALENELQEEKVKHQDALGRCQDLEEQLKRKDSCSVWLSSSAADADLKTKQDDELLAAAEKLAECQETIFCLRKQLNALHPSSDFTMGSPYSEKCLIGDMSEEEPGTNCTNLEDFYQEEMESAASTNFQRTGCGSPSELKITSYSLNTAIELLKSPGNSKPPKHRRTQSGSSSSSLEKQSRGSSNFFSSKGKNIC